MAFDWSPYRAVLFDVDGTIAETEGEGHLPAFNRVFQEFQMPWRWTTADYAQLLTVTGGFERMCAYAASVGDPITLSEAGREKLRRAHQRKNQVYAEMLQSGLILPRHGFVELIAQLTSDELPWAVVTTTSLSNWQALWEYAVKPAGRVTPPVLAVCGEDVERKKPDPQAYQQAVARLGLLPEQCIAIEDSQNGLAAARGAGVPSVIVRSQFFGHHDFPGAIAIVDELSDLLN